MTRGHITDEGTGPETGDELRRKLRARADLVPIPPPPVSVVRRRAQRRRRRRGMVQGLSGVVVTCAVAAGVAAWSPGRGDAVGPGRSNTEWSSAPSVTAPLRTPSRTPSRTPTTPTPTTSRTTSASDFLLASDLAAGWRGPVDSGASRPGLSLDGSYCESSGYYSSQTPVEPAPDKLYYVTTDDTQIGAREAIYTFAAGTGVSVMEKVRRALEAGCGIPQKIKLLTSPETVADEAIVFTVDGGDATNILVRSGDRVASVAVETLPAGQDSATWTDAVAKRMAAHLTGG